MRNAAQSTPYADYFKRKLEEYKVDSPADLSEEDKKKFFSEVEAGWDEETGTENVGGKAGTNVKGVAGTGYRSDEAKLVVSAIEAIKKSCPSLSESSDGIKMLREALNYLD